MPWGTWTLGTQTNLRFGVVPQASRKGLRISSTAGPDVQTFLAAPMTAGLIEIKNNRLVAAGSAPDFPLVPKWRKVVRQIG